PPLVPILFGHTGQIRHFTDLRISAAVRTVVVSESWLRALSSAERAAFDRAVAAARAANRAWARDIQDKEFAVLEAAGVKVTALAPGERARFMARSRPAYDHITTSEMVDRILALADAARRLP